MGTNKHTLNIENGPNLDRLLDLFKYSYDKAASIPANFVIAEGYTRPIGEPGCAFTALETSDFHIKSIAHESGNGSSYELSGWCKVALGKTRRTMKNENGVNVCSVWREYVAADFSAYYDARTRKGTITFFIN